MNRLEQPLQFPANPFVALADLLMLVVLVLVLVLVQQSLVSTGMLKRMAVEKQQVRLNTRIMDLPATIKGAAPVEQYWVDGDLQRFRIPGALCFGAGSADLKRGARASLNVMGLLLTQYHGTGAAPGYGPFKRVEVHGNVDRGECPSDRVLALSLRRAEAAARALMQGGLWERVLVVSGRGANDPAKQGQSADNRRVDIVVVYSAENVIKRQTEEAAKPAYGP